MTFKRIGMAALALGAALQASMAQGQTVLADWAQRPTAEQVGAAYPALATSLQIEGRAVLACAINPQGVLRDCAVESETPDGLGFGEGALRIAPYFRMHPSVVNGRAVGDSRVGIPVAFRLPKSTIPAPEDTLPTSAQALVLARRLVEAEGIRRQIVSAYLPNSPAAQKWATPAIKPPVLVDGAMAQMRAIQETLPAWTEAAARVYAATFTVDQLKANLAFAESPEGETIASKLAGFDAALRPLYWKTFRLGLAAGRDVFCGTHACLRTEAGAAFGPAPSILVPDWLESPAEFQLMQATPFAARALGLTGEVRLACTVLDTGLLRNCWVLHETPGKLGFGAAGLELSKLYRARPLPPGATAAAPSVEVTIRFPELPDLSPTFGAQPTFDAEPGEVRLALARRIVDVSDVQADARRRNETNMQEFDTIPTPGVDDAVRAEVRDALAQGADQSVAFFEVERVKQYAGLFTEAELRALLAWNSSAAGAERRAKLTLTSERMKGVNRWFHDETTRLSGEKFCAKRGCKTNLPPSPPETPPRL